MTDYIEELMRTARVEPTYKEPICCQDRRQVYGLNCLVCMKYDEDNGRCLANLIYPDFTTAKQLEIENLIINHKFPVYDFNQEKETLQYTPFGYFIENNKIAVMAGSGSSLKKAIAKDRTQALAQLTTELMKAGELDKEKVKGVLEG